MKKVYSVYDSKAEAFKPPFVAVSRGVAVRMIRAAAMDEATELHKFGADFTLFEIGEFDERTGRVEHLEAFVNLGTALVLGSLEE